HDRLAAPSRKSGRPRGCTMGRNAYPRYCQRVYDRAWRFVQTQCGMGILSLPYQEGRRSAQVFLDSCIRFWTTFHFRSGCFVGKDLNMGLLGILAALGFLIFLAYRGWSVLLLSPAAALLAAALAGEPLLAHWTQTFMGSASRFVMQFFPIFLFG